MKLGFVLAACALAAGCGASGADGNGPYCGDGVQQAGEQCDDGTSNGIPGDPCSATCTMASTGCGDGVLESGEECDDGSRNGAPPADCSATCTFNDPTVTVSWNILAAKTHSADTDQIGPCPWWPSGSNAPPAPSTTSIRLLGGAPGTPFDTCGAACTLATFDCMDGSGSVRLPKGTYAFALQPVQSTDVFEVESDPGNGPRDIEGDTSIAFQLHQGGNMHIGWSDLTASTCNSVSVSVYSSTDATNEPSDLQQVPVNDTVSGLPCVPAGTAMGPYPVVGPNLPGATAEYSVVVQALDLGGNIVASGAQTATIQRSNSTVSVSVILTPGG